jgi:peptidyl-prolyl cis-trans isomerase B (cyclophilin B)
MNRFKTNPPVKNEANNGLSNAKYTVAMARTNNPHSATSQFFINVRDNSHLDYKGKEFWGYAVFGKVIEGKSVVDRIKVVETGTVKPYPSSSVSFKDVPKKPIVIKKVSIVK